MTQRPALTAGARAPVAGATPCLVLRDGTTLPHAARAPEDGPFARLSGDGLDGSTR